PRQARACRGRYEGVRRTRRRGAARCIRAARSRRRRGSRLGACRRNRAGGVVSATAAAPAQRERRRRDARGSLFSYVGFGPLLVLVIVPFWSSYLLRVYSWLTILGEKGVINRFLQWTGITHHPLGVFLYDRPAVILVLVYLYFPFGALTLYSSIERFDWNQL